MENEIDILIVEDEALIAENIKMQLEDFGYNVMKVCYNYDTALQAIGENSFDVLITDINLGDGIDKKSGIQLAQQLKQTKSCPVIFLTAFSDKDTIKKATVLSPSAYLVKPVNAPNLFAAVQLAVENFETNKVIAAQVEEKPDYFFVKLGNKLIKVFWKDVYHMEAIKNYVKIKTTQYGSEVLIRGSLSQVLQNMLPAVYKNKFIKINRAEAIAGDIVIKIDNDVIETAYGKFNASSTFDKKELGI
jgi:two-component system, LytTR family, response regulator LytT